MMMTGPGRGRRRRGRRGQRSRQEEQNQEQQQRSAPQSGQDDGASDARSGAPERPARAARSPRDGDSAQQGERQGQSGGRKRSRGKRRANRRPAVGPMPTEVLRKEVRDVRQTGTIVLRRLDDFETQDGMTFGCPMLARTRLGMPFAQGRRVPRCSMGWALHNEEEASLCMRTPNLLDCWKEHPENEAALRASADDEESAAD